MQDVGAKLVSLRVVTRAHLASVRTAALAQRRLLARRQTEARNAHPAGTGEDQPDARGSRPPQRRISWHSQRDGAARPGRRTGDRAGASAFASIAIAASSTASAISPCRRFARSATCRRCASSLRETHSGAGRLGRRIERRGSRAARGDGRRVRRRRRRRDWLRLARSLGSDVPFFLAGTGALVEGTGERVTPAGALPAMARLDRQAAGRRLDRGRLSRARRARAPAASAQGSVLDRDARSAAARRFRRVESLLAERFSRA